MMEQEVQTYTAQWNHPSITSRAPQSYKVLLEFAHLSHNKQSRVRTWMRRMWFPDNPSIYFIIFFLTEAWLSLSACRLQTTIFLIVCCRRQLTQLCLDDLVGWFVHLRCQWILIWNDSVTNVGCSNDQLFLFDFFFFFFCIHLLCVHLFPQRNGSGSASSCTICLTKTEPWTLR